MTFSISATAVTGWGCTNILRLSITKQKWSLRLILHLYAKHLNIVPNSDGMSCEDAITRAFQQLLQYENRDMDDESSILKTLVRFYQNAKHYQNNDNNPRKDKSFAVAMPSEKRIALLYFAKRLFQLSLLHELLEDSTDVFDNAYAHLCQDANHLVSKAWGHSIFRRHVKGDN